MFGNHIQHLKQPIKHDLTSYKNSWPYHHDAKYRGSSNEKIREIKENKSWTGSTSLLSIKSSGSGAGTMRSIEYRAIESQDIKKSRDQTQPREEHRKTVRADAKLMA